MSFTFLYYKAQINLEVFPTENKMKKTSINNQVYFTFWKGELAEYQHLTIINCVCKHV